METIRQSLGTEGSSVGDRDYEAPAIAERASVGDPLILGYISPKWRPADEEA